MYLVRMKQGPHAGNLYAMKVLKKAKIVSSDKDTAHIKSERNILATVSIITPLKTRSLFQNHNNIMQERVAYLCTIMIFSQSIDWVVLKCDLFICC